MKSGLVKIVSDGTPRGTIITTESGEELVVNEMTIYFSPDHMTEVNITLHSDGVEVSAIPREVQQRCPFCLYDAIHDCPHPESPVAEAQNRVIGGMD